ncbi:protein kinase, partial [Nonomuraea sp. NN258]|uniref:serine/threonine protein kinase n=1 Tax=Nonomuraea antri TaxID=2730852 RepID=UPI0015683AF2
GWQGGLAAIKVIRHDFDGDEAVTRFRREVATLADVRSPYAAALLGAGLDAPPYWLATAYVPGPTVSQAVDRWGPLPSGVCLRLLGGLAAALADLHGRGVQHRDLKPSNVILSPDGPRLIDFGIARAVGQSTITRSGDIIGTPGYIAPEAVRRQPVTPAADVFALAGTVAYAATGRPPFGGGEGVAILYRTLNEELDLEGVEAGLAGLLALCATKDPADRITPAALATLCGTGVLLREGPLKEGRHPGENRRREDRLGDPRGKGHHPWEGPRGKDPRGEDPRGEDHPGEGHRGEDPRREAHREEGRHPREDPRGEDPRREGRPGEGHHLGEDRPREGRRGEGRHPGEDPRGGDPRGEDHRGEDRPKEGHPGEG